MLHRCLIKLQIAQTGNFRFQLFEEAIAMAMKLAMTMSKYNRNVIDCIGQTCVDQSTSFFIRVNKREPLYKKIFKNMYLSMTL